MECRLIETRDGLLNVGCTTGIEGCGVGASLWDKAKPVAIKRYSRACHGCGLEAAILGSQACRC